MRALQTDTNFDTGQMIGIGVPVKVMMAYAANLEEAAPGPLGAFGSRILTPSGMPVGRYDFIANLPHGSREALAEAIKQEFGLVGRRTNIVVPCYVLKFDHAGGPGLKPATPGSAPSGVSYGVTPNFWPNMTIDDFIGFQIGMFPELAGFITNETGLTGKYDIDWTPVERVSKRKPNETLLDRLQRELTDNLGLQLIVSNRVPVEFFQIERVK